MAHSRESLETKRELENFTRINRLLQRVATPVVKVLFDREFHPEQLRSTLAKWRIECRKQKSINQYQLTLLYPANGKPTSSDFDLTLLISLLRHLDTKIPIQDIFPITADTSVAASLSRLKYYRIKVAHSHTLTLSCEEFEIWWSDITNAILVLGGESYKEKCKQLKYCSLDEKDLSLEIKKIVNSVREPEREEYLYWMEDTERYFAIPAAINEITEAFKQNRFIVISGHAGTGKTALARYVALNLYKNQDMSIFPVNNPNIIQHQLALRYQINSAAHKLKVKNMPVSAKKKQTKQAKPIKVLALDTHGSNINQSILIFVIDDFLGRYTINKRLSNAWNQLYYEHFHIPCNEIYSIYILATCREEIRETCQFTSLKDLYKFEEYNTSEFEENGNKLNIASCHMNPSTTEILFADEKIQKDHKFSTFCFLYSHLLPTENIDFFNNPNVAFKREFKEIRSRSEPCYIGLALLTIYDGKLRKPLSDQISDELVSKLCVECKLSKKGMRLSQIQQELDKVVGRYMIDEVTAYSLVHPELYDILLNYFIKKIPKSLINFGSNDFLQSRIKLEGFTSDPFNLSTFVHVKEKQHQELYFNRLIKDIKQKEFENAFRNMQVAKSAYQEHLIWHVQKSDEVLHIYEILASSCLPLILSVENDFSKLVGLILEKREEFNMSRVVEFERQEDFEVIDYEDRKLLNLQSLINDGEMMLMLACLCGSVRVVELFLGLGYDINYQNSIYKTPIHLACLRGNDEVVKLLLGIQFIKDDDGRRTSLETECDIDIQDINGLTALHMACKNGHKKVIDLLLNKWRCSLRDADKQGRIALFTDKLNVTDNQGRLALHIAAGNGSADVIDILFRAVSLTDCSGPVIHTEVIHDNNHLCNLINAQDQNGKTFLFAACENGFTNCVDYLLKFRCCDIDIYNDRNETPVFRACQNGYTEIVHKLVALNAKVNITDKTGRTPLHVSVESKNENMVKCILDNKNCIVNITDGNYFSALHLAIFGKNLKIVKTLLEAECYDKCDINQTDSNKNTPLMLAISADATHIVELLIESGCNLNKYNSDGKQAFHIACEGNCNGDIIEFFLKLKTDFNSNCWDRLGRTGLHHAVIGNNTKAIKLLLKTNININKQDENKETALYSAYQSGKLEIVTEFLKTPGCDINLSNKACKSILHMACERNEISFVRTLLRKNCAINAEDELGRTPLHIAMNSNYLDIFTVLVHRSDVNSKYMNGWTPLHMACRQQCVAAVKLLLQTACDVNIQDNTGKTALHIAASGRESSIVNELLEVKCNVNLCDNKGKTALSYALENHNKEVFKKLKTV